MPRKCIVVTFFDRSRQIIELDDEGNGKVEYVSPMAVIKIIVCDKPEGGERTPKPSSG
jgi:hypothetical protein